MKRFLIITLLSLLLLVSCKPQEIPKKELFCGDNVCQDDEKENGCKEDCGGVAGITKLQCTNVNGYWNDCGSACAGTDAEFCIQVCSAQCECGGIAGYKCPERFKCRLSGKIKDEIGVCIK